MRDSHSTLFKRADMTSHFDKKAKDWDKKKMRLELASSVANAISGLDLNRKMRCMDFGCGTGLVGLAIAEKIETLVAFDSSEGMLDVLQNKANDMGLSNVNPLHGNILTAEIAEPFDLIFSSMTLHHIENVNPIMEKLYSVTKSGGMIAIADLDKEDGSFHKEGSEEKHHGFERDQLTDLLRSTGFSDIQFQTVHTITKSGKDGKLKDFTVFLATARKDAE